MNAPQAREMLEAEIRRQLRDAFDRGVRAAGNPADTLYDELASQSFKVLSSYADQYAIAIAARWRGPADGVPADTPDDGDAP